MIYIHIKGVDTVSYSLRGAEGQVGWGSGKQDTVGGNLFPRQRVWNQMIFKVPSNSSSSVILWFLFLHVAMFYPVNDEILL